MTSIFVFRRDLRLDDNTGLVNVDDEIIPVFILDPRQTETNEYKSDRAIEFMLFSLIELRDSVRDRGGELYVIKGIPEEVLPKLSQKFGAELIMNRDYTPFSRARDQKIKATFFDDYLLIGDPDKFEVKRTFSSFYRDALKSQPRRPIPFKGDFREVELESVELRSNSPLGGRQQCMEKLDGLKDMTEVDYEGIRNDPMNPIMLSPYIKFGTCSIREVYYASTHIPSLVRQLYWRDYYTLIAYRFPKVFGNPFDERYRNIRWDNNNELIEKWKEGKTGFPIVDAGMRQLNKEGFIHNRIRLVASSFLVKVLHVDWRIGEKYFATKLIDYDPSVNNGNWQWVASMGLDPVPYVRVFNPWIQQKKLDPNCNYVKEYIPEINDVDCKKIHEAYKYDLTPYPSPVVNYRDEIERTKREYMSLT